MLPYMDIERKVREAEQFFEFRLVLCFAFMLSRLSLLTQSFARSNHTTVSNAMTEKATFAAGCFW